jgi:hypothetical protein
MTIAACYVSSEGVVLGADSTSTMSGPKMLDQFYEHEQKVFEIGECGTLAITMWGMGGVGPHSYRTMIAELGDDLDQIALRSVEEVASLWRDRFWAAYEVELADVVRRDAEIAAKPSPTTDELQESDRMRALYSGGFCIGGRVHGNRRPEAFTILYSPQGANNPVVVPQNIPQFWGVPNLINRVLYGADDELFSRIMDSPHWKGSAQDLFDLISPGMLRVPGRLPLREAIDWVYSSIFLTIKALKFSSLPPYCGGPIEVAAVTSDRRFRWVSHKRLGEAVLQGHNRGSVQ